MNAAVISATVAGIAVVVGAVMQYLTLRANRESTLLTLDEGRRSTEQTLSEARETARMTALATTNQEWEEGLRSDLAEFCTLTYDVETAYKWAVHHKVPWPGDKMDVVNQVDVLYGRLMLRLDTRKPSQRDLADAVRGLMATESQELWIERRDRTLELATVTFSTRWTEILGEVEGQSKSASDRDAPRPRHAADRLGPGRTVSVRQKVVWAAGTAVVLAGGVALLSLPELSTTSLADSLRGAYGADVVDCDPSEKVQGQWICTMTFASGKPASRVSADAAPTQRLVAVHGDDAAERYFAVEPGEDASGAEAIKQLRSAAAAQTFADAGKGRIETVDWKLFGRLTGN